MLWKQTAKIVLFILTLVLALPLSAMAIQSCSTSFCVNESVFSSGGQLNACSSNFCSKQTAGEQAVGNASSTNFQTQAGFNTDRAPFIEFNVSNTNIDLGSLTTTTTKTATATFSVKAYLSHGYDVTNASDPPTNGSYTMQPITIPAGSQVGTEQFGINLVANTSPTTFGSYPVHTPDNTFSFGQVSTDYVTPDFYKYNKGDIIAFSNASSSATNYTISYIFNVGNVTPGGTYTLHHVLVATATF